MPEIGWHSYLLGHVPIIDINPRDKVYKEELAREAKAQSRIGHVHPADERYEERSNVERVNAGLKDNCSGRHVRVRGHAKVYCHLMFAMLVLTVDQLMRLLTDLNAVSDSVPVMSHAPRNGAKRSVPASRRRGRNGLGTAPVRAKSAYQLRPRGTSKPPPARLFISWSTDECHRVGLRHEQITPRSFASGSDASNLFLHAIKKCLP